MTFSAPTRPQPARYRDLPVRGSEPFVARGIRAAMLQHPSAQVVSTAENPSTGEITAVIRIPVAAARPAVARPTVPPPARHPSYRPLNGTQKAARVGIAVGSFLAVLLTGGALLSLASTATQVMVFGLVATVAGLTIVRRVRARHGAACAGLHCGGCSG